MILIGEDHGYRYHKPFDCKMYNEPYHLVCWWCM